MKGNLKKTGESPDPDSVLPLREFHKPMLRRRLPIPYLVQVLLWIWLRSSPSEQLAHKFSLLQPLEEYQIDESVSSMIWCWMYPARLQKKEKNERRVMNNRCGKHAEVWEPLQ